MEENKVTETAEKKPSPFAGIMSQKGLKAKIKFFFDVLEKYPDVREAVMYFLFSIICGASQMASQFLLQYTLVLVPALANPFRWFIFKGDTAAEFIGFMVGAVVSNTLTYILNRKKTFRSTNNLALSITLYTIMMVILTIMQTLVPGYITEPCIASFKAGHGGAEPAGIVGFLIKLTGTATAGMTALVLSFLGNKFIVMRNWGAKKKAKEESENAAATETAAEDAETYSIAATDDRDIDNIVVEEEISETEEIAETEDAAETVETEVETEEAEEVADTTEEVEE